MKLENLLTHIPAGLTPSEIVKKASLEWGVMECEGYFKMPEGEMIKTARKSIVRDDNLTELTTAKAKWNPLQNADAIATFYNFCQRAGTSIEYAGEICGGRRILAIAKPFAEYDVKKVGDLVNARAAFISSHEHGVGHKVCLLLTRLACTNGAFKQVKANLQIVNHCNPSLQTMGNIEAALKSCWKTWENYGEEADKLAQAPVTAEQATIQVVKNFGDPSLPIDEQPAFVQDVLNMFCGDMIGSEFSSVFYTAWGLLQSVVEYYNHRQKYRSSALAQLSTGYVGQKVSAFQKQLVSAYLK